MRVLGLTPYPDLGPSSRVRAYQFVEPLAEWGIDLEILPFIGRAAYTDRFRSGRRGSTRLLMDAGRSFMRRWWLTWSGSHWDAIIVSKYMSPLGGSGMVELLARSPVPLIFDVDDDVFWRRDSRKLASMADCVVAGTSHLETLARESGADYTTVIPSTVRVPATEDVLESSQGVAGEPVVGWIGTAESFGTYLKPMLSCLVRASREAGGRVVICGPKQVCADVAAAEADFVEWSLETEEHLLRKMQVGVMPLVHEAHARGKCSYKAIRYASYGVPCVSSNVGSASLVIENGRTGYLSDGVQEMLDGVVSLLTNPDRRMAMGERARAHVIQHYRAEDAAKQWEQLLRDLPR